MFHLLRTFGMNQVMIWPMTELAPPPLSANDREHLSEFRKVVQMAEDLGLECWLVFCANLSTTDAVRACSMINRVFYPNMRKFRLDDSQQFDSYMSHLSDILRCLDNADGYVFIDGDPGGYPGAMPEDFMRMLHGVRGILDQSGREQRPKIVPWVWSGWGADWEKEGVWKPDLRRLVMPFLKALQAGPPGEPWELLPGRSIREGHANGRTNFVLTEEVGLLHRATLMTYEIIEFEPTPPAFVIQFDDIRRVIREEIDKANVVRGIMGNAQQPVSALHNLFYFARCAESPEWLDRSDESALHALADMLGGEAEVLIPAWTASRNQLDRIPFDLAQRVQNGRLKSETARMIPGGADMYLGILSEFVRARVEILRQTCDTPLNSSDAAQRIAAASVAIIRWWSRHRYVFTGAESPGFKWSYTHQVLMQPLYAWIKQHGHLICADAHHQIYSRIADSGLIDQQTAMINTETLLRDPVSGFI
ncbi:MAG: hypothetical protein JW808_03055 [Victivallales bacterium]|nr:hypothetical protein [Victivallales bacterium]